jgi:hypothetical protein
MGATGTLHHFTERQLLVTSIRSTSTAASTPDNLALLLSVVAAAQAAGAQLLSVYSADSRPAGRADIFAAGRRNEDISLAVLSRC